MATAVEYLYGTQAKYDALATKDPMAFYKTEKNLYLGEWKLSGDEDVKALEDDVGDLDTLTTDDKTNLVAAINELKEAIENSTGGKSEWKQF